MAEEFYLKVIASDRIFFSGPALAVIVPTADGEYEFLAHHGSAFIAITPGEARCQKPDGTWVPAIVGNGIAQTANNRTTILVESAERPEEIDEVRAREELEQAQEELRQKQSIQEYNISQASLSRAMARLKGRRNYTGNK